MSSAAESRRLVRVLSRAELTEGGYGVVTRLEGRDVLVVMSAGQVYAVDNICTHRTLWLDHARLYPDTFELECPWHLGRFDLRTGAATLEPCVTRLRTYPVVIDGDDVFLDVSEAADQAPPAPGP